jgi:hypothetical protein
MGLFGSVPGLILIHVIFNLPLATLIFRNFYVGHPEELSRRRASTAPASSAIFFSVLLPLSGDGRRLPDPALHRDLERLPVRPDLRGQGNAPMTVQLSNIVRRRPATANTTSTWPRRCYPRCRRSRLFLLRSLFRARHHRRRRERLIHAWSLGTRHQQVVRRAARPEEHRSRDRPASSRPARALGMRQVDAAQRDRGLDECDDGQIRSAPTT